MIWMIYSIGRSKGGDMIMKKMFIYATVMGVVAGVGYCLCKKEKSNAVRSKVVGSNTETVDKTADTEICSQEEDVFQHTNVEEEMYQAKSESAQTIYERHLEANSLMKEVYSNIMEDVVEDFSGEKDENENKEVIINSDSVAVMKEIDAISDELDELLK